MKSAPFETFQEAVAAMPLCLVGGYDALSHKTIEDLQFIAMHELDLYGEGEVELSHSDLSAVVKYRNRIINTITRWRHRITIECPQCGLTERVDRQPHDPPQAHRCEIKCPECVGSDFDQTFYFDADGRELVSDDGQAWRAL